MSNSKKHLLLICSPNPSILIQWKSILQYLEDNNFKITFFFPKPSAIHSIISYLNTPTDSDLSIKYLIASNPLLPFSHKEFSNLASFKNFVGSSKYVRKSRYRILFSKIARRFFGNHLYPYLSNLISKILFLNILSKNNLKNYLPDDFRILSDIDEISKLYLSPYSWMFAEQKVLSLSHGYDINTTYTKSIRSTKIRNNIYILVYTGKNKSYYYNKFGVKKSNIIVIGITNHQCLRSKNNDEDISSEKSHTLKYISLLLRPRDNINFCSPSSYDEYLMLIGIWIKNNQDYHLFVKAHPKQTNITLDSVLTSMGLPLSFSRVTMTMDSSVDLAAISQFGISFYSGTCVDFAFHSKPMLELTDPFGTLFGELTQTFDPFGLPITGFSNHNLCITVFNPLQFQTKITSILTNYSYWSNRANLAYNDTFPSIPNALPLIRDILS